MFVIIGVVIIFGSIGYGYSVHGDFAVLMQPLEVLIMGIIYDSAEAP